MINIAILGAGGHTRSLLTIVNNSIFNIKGIFDDNFLPDEQINGYQLAGRIEDIPQNLKIVLSVGDNIKRAGFYHKFKPQLVYETLKHQTAILENNVLNGIANQIFARVVINSNVHIDDNNIINTGCIIEHESRIGSHNHLSVNATICGRVHIGSNCFIGAGAVIIDGISICDNVTVGANSVVIKNITDPGVYVGNPVRRIK